MSPAQPLLIAVMGPTASGKSAVAEAIADRIDAVILNADAFQVYRGMDIGTAKAADRTRYRLLDLKDPGEGFGLGEWLALALAELRELFAQNRNAVVVGGTGLYVRALFEEYDDVRGLPSPELRAELERRIETEGLGSIFSELQRVAPDEAARIDPLNPSRVRRALERALNPSVPQVIKLPPFVRIKWALERNIETLETAIARRTDEMMQNGWLLEVETLRNLGYGPKSPGFRALGYTDLWQHLEGEMEYRDAVANIVRDTRRYAKRQRTWLRTEPRLVTLEGESVEANVRSALVQLNAFDGGM